MVCYIFFHQGRGPVLTLFGLGFLRVAGPGGGGVGEGVKVPATLRLLMINNKVKFGGAVENHKLINLVSFNCHITSSLRHNNIKNQNLEILQISC